MRQALRTTTTSMLLDGLRDVRNSEVWEAFDDRYRTIITGLARRMGLQPPDDDDVAQETLVQFARDYQAGKYVRGQGKLRSWILGIARHRIADLHRHRARRREWREASGIDAVPSDERLSEIWDEEHEAEILRQGLAELREVSRLDTTTVEIFERMVLKQESPATISEELGIPAQSVYRAKHRCLGRLSRIVASLETRYRDE